MAIVNTQGIDKAKVTDWVTFNTTAHASNRVNKVEDI